MTDWQPPSSLRDRRIEYETAGLDVADVDPDPLEQWRRWFDEAIDAGATEPSAMVLSTTGLDGNPDARIVLARAADDRGLGFYTNYESAKSRQIVVSPTAAATFSWLELHRQVRLRGRVEAMSDAESDDDDLRRAEKADRVQPSRSRRPRKGSGRRCGQWITS